VTATIAVSLATQTITEYFPSKDVWPFRVTTAMELTHYVSYVLQIAAYAIHQASAVLAS